MATVLGPRGTLNVGQSQRKVDMASQIALLEPDATPLVVFTKALNKAATVNPEYSWQEDTLDQRFDTQNGGATNSATTVNVNNGPYFGPQDLVLNTRTNEIFRVVSVATNALTVVRGVGTVAGTAMNNADELLVIGSAAMEGDVSKAARSQNPTKVTNYTQIFRKPVESTETQIHSDQFTQPNDWAYQANKAGIEHAKDLEYAFLLGQKFEDSSGSQPRRGTGGAFAFVTSNVTAVGGALTEASFFGAIRPAMRYGSKEKTIFASALVTDVLNTYARGKVQVVDQGSTSYGVKVMRYQSPHGTTNVITHWLLEGTKYGGTILGIDLSQVKYRYLANENGSRDTHIRRNIQAPDADTEKDEYLTEAGLQFGLDKTHFLLTGITG